MAGEDWHYGFMKRHPNVSLRTSEQMSRGRGGTASTAERFLTNMFIAYASKAKFTQLDRVHYEGCARELCTAANVPICPSFYVRISIHNCQRKEQCEFSVLTYFHQFLLFFLQNSSVKNIFIPKK